MKTIEVVQVSYFNYILDELNRLGENTDKLKRRSNLDKFEVSNIESYVPVNHLHDLLGQIKNSIGSNFIEVFKDSVSIKNLANFGDLLLVAPDIQTAIESAKEICPLFYSTQKISYDIKGPLTYLYVRLAEKNHLSKDVLYQLELGLIIDNIRMACGEDWNPLEIHLPMNYMPNLESILSKKSSVTIEINAPYLVVVFHTSVLKETFKSQAPNTTVDLELSSNSVKIEKILSSYKGDILPSIREVSEMFATSESSFRRLLSTENTSYSQIVEGWRFKQALQLLSQPQLNIREISERLGYTKPQNFIRSFKRLTGVTPRVYRENL